MDEIIQKKLHDLFVIYTKNLPDKIHHIETQWQELMTHWNIDSFKTFHRDVHSLCGSAGTYGYSELSKVARQMEIYLKNLLNNKTITNQQHNKIIEFIVQLKSVLTIPIAENLPIFGSESTDNIEKKIVYIVEPDKHLTAELCQSLNDIGFNAYPIKDLGILQLAVQEKPPIAIIIDTEILGKLGIQIILDIQKQQTAPAQLFCILPNDELLPRLEAIRVGCNAFFQKPVDIVYLIRILNHKCNSNVGEPFRILIIDDSESLCDYYSLILNQAGMVTHTISNPMQLLKELEIFQPDLLLMDIYMPECTGLELAAVLRQESYYTKIPIIFLSTEDNQLKKLSAISLGGDDFLTKPISAQHLISAVRSRTKRASVLNYYMVTDSLTGLLNHSNILRQLTIECERAKQNNLPLSFVMIDIDHFKKVNDSYGHPSGDIVLKKLATLLLIRFRTNQDIVGRYGGEEFTIILPSTTVHQSQKICEELLQQFSQFCFTMNNKKFFVTFSAGISSLRENNDSHSIVEEADQALYNAKQLGRNRVVIYDE